MTVLSNRATVEPNRLATVTTAVTNAIREILALAVAWVGAVIGIFAACYMFGIFATGKAPGVGTTGPTQFGIAFTVPTLVSVTLAAATVFVGAYWALGIRSRAARVLALGLAIALGATAFMVGRALPVPDELITLLTSP